MDILIQMIHRKWMSTKHCLHHDAFVSLNKQPKYFQHNTKWYYYSFQSASHVQLGPQVFAHFFFKLCDCVVLTASWPGEACFSPLTRKLKKSKDH